MKKLLLLTKTLLAAALLCVGQNAWGAWTTVFTQDYENLSSIDEGWTTSSTGRYTSAQYTRSGDTHYARYNAGNTNGATLTYAGLTTTSIVGSSYGTSTQYKIEFDMAIIPANASNSSGAQTPVFTLYDSSNNSLCHWQVTTAAKTAAANSTGSFYLGSAGSETASFTANTSPYWYHITIEAASESSTTMTVKDISTMTETEYTLSKSFIYLGKFTYVTGKIQGGICLDNLTVSIYTDSEIVSDPTIGDPVYAGANRTITITGGVSSKSNAVTTYYTIDGTDPSASNKEGSFTTSTKDVTISSNCTVKAITISSESVASNITSKAVTVGKLTLNTPSLSITDFTKSGSDYYPQYAFSSDQTSVLGNPTVTYTYTIDGTPSAGNVTEYAEAKAGTLVVSANAEGYTSATTEVTVYKYSQRIGYDFTNAEFPLNSNWTLENNNTSMKGGTYVDGDGNTIKGKRYQPADNKVNENGYLFDNVAFSYNDKSLYYFVTGLGLGYAGGSGHNTTTITINGLTANSYTVYKKQSDANPQSFSKSVVAGNNTFAMNKYSGTGAYVLQGIYVYDSADKDVVDAIADCKAFETSSEFATAIGAESFSTAAEVYAFHTAWQIAKAKASGSTDITKVIRNAAVTSTTDWVGSRVIELGSEVYNGAPDNFLIDANNQVMDTYQMLYGLPAGKYTVKAATRANAEVTSGKIYVYAEGQVDKNADGHHVGNTGGDLEHGWSWTSIDFELTSTSDVKIGYYVDATGKWASCDDWHLTKTGDIVKLNAAGYATYSANYDVEVSGAKAYTAVLDFTNSKITCSEITSNKIPAGNGVLLYGDANADVTLSITADAAALGTNNLKATTKADGTLATKGSNNYYALDGDTFKKYTGGEFVHNKAYFEVTAGSEVLARSMSIVFEGNITGVANVEAAAEAKAKEGKFIENGKLVIVKNGQKFNAAGAKLY